MKRITNITRYLWNRFSIEAQHYNTSRGQGMRVIQSCTKIDYPVYLVIPSSISHSVRKTKTFWGLNNPHCGTLMRNSTFRNNINGLAIYLVSFTPLVWKLLMWSGGFWTLFHSRRGQETTGLLNAGYKYVDCHPLLNPHQNFYQGEVRKLKW